LLVESTLKTKMYR